MLFISFTNYFHNFIFLLSKSTETAITVAHNKLWYSILLSIALTDFPNIFVFIFLLLFHLLCFRTNSMLKTIFFWIKSDEITKFPTEVRTPCV